MSLRYSSDCYQSSQFFFFPDGSWVAAGTLAAGRQEKSTGPWAMGWISIYQGPPLVTNPILRIHGQGQIDFLARGELGLARPGPDMVRIDHAVMSRFAVGLRRV